MSDARGALADATLTVDGKISTLVPAEIAPDIFFGGDQKESSRLTLFGARVDGIRTVTAMGAGGAIATARGDIMRRKMYGSTTKNQMTTIRKAIIA